MGLVLAEASKLLLELGSVVSSEKRREQELKALGRICHHHHCQKGNSASEVRKHPNNARHSLGKSPTKLSKSHQRNQVS